MWFKLIFGLCVVISIDAISMITLPTIEVDKAQDKIAAEKPYVMLSPDDPSLKSIPMYDIEKSHHGHIKVEDAKNLVDLAESLNLTTLVKALEETGLDNIIDHEGIDDLIKWHFKYYFLFFLL